jgi:hypothetical protein
MPPQFAQHRVFGKLLSCFLSLAILSLGGPLLPLHLKAPFFAFPAPFSRGIFNPLHG